MLAIFSCPLSEMLVPLPHPFKLSDPPSNVRRCHDTRRTGNKIIHAFSSVLLHHNLDKEVQLCRLVQSIVSLLEATPMKERTLPPNTARSLSRSLWPDCLIVVPYATGPGVSLKMLRVSTNIPFLPFMSPMVERDDYIRHARHFQLSVERDAGSSIPISTFLCRTV